LIALIINAHPKMNGIDSESLVIILLSTSALADGRRR